MSILPVVPSFADDRLKDLLGRAQQGLDARAVEDLIGRLEGGKPKPAPKPAETFSPPGAGQPVGLPQHRLPTAPPSELAAPAPPAPSEPAAVPTVAVPPSATAPVGAPSPAAGQIAAPIAEPAKPAARPDTASAPPAAAPPVAATPEAIAPAAPLPPSAAQPVVAAPSPAPPAISPAAPASQAAAAVAKADQQLLPSIDLEITFAFNSAEIAPVALPTLALLGKAISDPRLAAATFVIAGHTDARGSDDVNLRMSQLRADAVKSFLVTNFGIDPRRLTARGFGETRLKNKKNPRADENRRVQIVNTSALAQR